MGSGGHELMPRSLKQEQCAISARIGDCLPCSISRWLCSGAINVLMMLCSAVGSVVCQYVRSCEAWLWQVSICTRFAIELYESSAYLLSATNGSRDNCHIAI